MTSHIAGTTYNRIHGNSSDVNIEEGLLCWISAFCFNGAIDIDFYNSGQCSEDYQELSKSYLLPVGNNLKDKKGNLHQDNTSIPIPNLTITFYF